MDSTRPPRTIGVAFFMKDAYPLFNPDCAGVFGGAEVDLYFTACALAKNKRYRVTFFVGDYGQHDVETREGVRLIRLKYSNLQQYNKWYHKIIRRVYIIRELLRDDSDVLITKTASDTLAFMVLFSRILKGKRVIFKLGSDIDADMGFWKQKDLCIYYLYKYSIPFVDAIICQTAAQQQMLAPRLAARSLIIKNGFPILEERHEVDREYILWVSRLDYMKQPELCVQLARELPQEQFVMIMPGSGAGRSELIESLRTADNLTLLEGVPFGNMQGYFNRAKCFVNTSAFEGFPNTFIQACLAGTPILSFAVNPDGFIDTYNLGCCCHNSMEQAVSFINSLDAAALRRYGQNAVSYVREHHSIVDKIRQYEQLIDNLL